MRALSPRIVVGVGMLVSACLFFPLFQLFLGDCFFEQGCAPHEGAKVLGVLLVAAVAGISVGGLAALLVSRIAKARAG